MNKQSRCGNEIPILTPFLDPYVGCFVFVPCLGKAVIREFFYDEKETELNSSPHNLNSGDVYDKMYVVNKQSSMVAVFQADKRLIFLINATVKNGKSIDQS